VDLEEGRIVMIACDPNVVVPQMKELQPGEKIVYHTGFLANDCCVSMMGDKSGGIKLIARAAMDLWEDQRVHLTQRRLSSGTFEYIATGAF
jgi:hypothetical protein